MQRLSDTLLRLARAGVDLRDPKIEVIDLDGVVREAIDRMKSLAEAADLKLRVEGRDARVWADHEWLEQVLLIVLRNSVQHSGRKNTVRVCLEGGTLVIEDEGIGISAQDLPHVFERFYRASSGSGGFGLGLPICKELVERMDGSITLDSKEGVGTTVKIKLPEVESA
jgi:signal transduction histidine kinase